MNKYLGVSLLLLCVYFLFHVVLLQLTFEHEYVHRAVLNQDGCSNVSVIVNYFNLGGETKCLEQDYNESSNAQLLHGFNEVVTYNNSAVIIAIMVFCMLFMVMLYEK